MVLKMNDDISSMLSKLKLIELLPIFESEAITLSDLTRLMTDVELKEKEGCGIKIFQKDMDEDAHGQSDDVDSTAN